ncbi:MAG: hypothetical protein GKR94_08090 [Gammaproteobacteria bacterium]|nr:hypothetical protein [Gammaproteobacteria bacterium]
MLSKSEDDDALPHFLDRVADAGEPAFGTAWRILTGVENEPQVPLPVSDAGDHPEQRWQVAWRNLAELARDAADATPSNDPIERTREILADLEAATEQFLAVEEEAWRDDVVMALEHARETLASTDLAPLIDHVLDAIGQNESALNIDEPEAWLESLNGVIDSIREAVEATTKATEASKEALDGQNFEAAMDFTRVAQEQHQRAGEARGAFSALLNQALACCVQPPKEPVAGTEQPEQDEDDADTRVDDGSSTPTDSDATVHGSAATESAPAPQPSDGTDNSVDRITAEAAEGGYQPNVADSYPASLVDEDSLAHGASSETDRTSRTSRPVRLDAPSANSMLAAHGGRGRDPDEEHSAIDGAGTAPRPSDWSSQARLSDLTAKLTDPHANRDLLLNALLWCLVRDERLGLAYHLAAHHERDQAEAPVLPSSALVEAIVYSLHLRNPTGRDAYRLRDVLPLALASADAGRVNPHIVPLYLLAATLRPALIAPDTTGAFQVLERITFPASLQALTQLTETVGEFRSFGMASNPAFFRSAHQYDAWRSQLTAFQARAREWWASAREHTLKYGPATHIWREWLRPDGPLGELIARLIAVEPREKDQVKERVNAWQQIGHVRKELERTDERIRKRRAKQLPIEGQAKSDLISRVSGALDLATEWLGLIDCRPGQLDAGGGAYAQKMRDRIQDIIPNCLTQLDHFIANNPDSLAITAGASLAKVAVAGFRETLLEGMSPELPAPRHVLHGELLRLEDCPIEGEWDIKSIPELPELLNLVEQPLTGKMLTDVFRKHCGRCRHDLTALVIDYGKHAAAGDLPPDEFEDQRESSLVECRQSLAVHQEKLKAEIEQAVVEGLLPESERLALLDRADSTGAGNDPNFAAQHAVLEEARTSLSALRQQCIDELRTQLDQSELEVDRKRDINRIRALLDDGNVLTASEYFSLVTSGTELPEQLAKRNAFSEFYPDKAQAIATFLSKEGYTKSLMRQLEAGEVAGPLDFRALGAGEAKSAVNLMRTWQRFKAVRQNAEQLELTARELMQNFGFQVIDLSLEERTDKVRWADVDCQPVSDKDLCGLPRYGSAAHGHYRLVMVWDGQPPNEILGICKNPAIDAPIVVLYGGTLSNSRRREFAELCRDRRQSVLVVDESLAYFLAMEKGSRLPGLIQCCAPFSVDNPYTIASSNVPVEMFYGRQIEMDNLLDPLGSNLVYGGRQLGKTALLREVQRRNHDPTQGVHVYWIDLKPAGIGLNRPATEIWQVLASTLSRDGLVDASVTRYDTLASNVRKWLEHDTRRRILMLLDETDAFLASDSRDHGHDTLAKLKELMDSTNRRFKVVFAGLHNVQRTARDANTPIAHLGRPLCIGPLVAGSDIREAVNLIVQPFALLGYRFKPEVASRILSYTNYYPSLIQIFCWHLIEHLSGMTQRALRIGSAPPFEITAEHIEEAYLQNDLRSSIAERFRFTLDLDGRYKIIALRISLETLYRRAAGDPLTEGSTVEWIRDEALGLWPKGFDDKSFEGFRVLLDEMEGLGLLRHMGYGTDRYALRSPNVIALLGTQGEIEDSLLDAAEQEPEATVYDAGSYRRMVAPDIFRLSAFSGHQEALLLGDSADGGRRHRVGAIFGFKAAGFDYIEPSLRALGEQLPDVQVKRLNVSSTLRELQKDVEKATSGRPEDGAVAVCLWVIPAEVPWTEDWVADIARRVGKLRSRKIRHRVLFQGDSATAWRWSTAPISLRDEARPVGPFTCYLAPWTDDTLRRWLGDAQIGAFGDTQERARLAHLAGNWGEILHGFGEAIRSVDTTWREQLEMLNSNPDRFCELIDEIPADLHPMLAALAGHQDPLSAEDIAALAEVQNESLLADAIRWGDNMGILEAQGRGKWRVPEALCEALALIDR